MKKILKNKKFLLYLIIVIFIIGAGLRIYRHHAFLHFELDQARDAMIADLALKEGVGELPLMGPRAAGTTLRLGPFFYYNLYLSGLIFGDSPASMNILGLIVGIATIPLFYLFFKLNFKKFISIGLTLLTSVSIFLIVYSKFAWNPNMLPFFSLLIMMSLVLLFNKPEQKLKIKNKLLNFIYNKRFVRLSLFYLLSFSLAIIIQLHFLAFVAIPITVLAYAFWSIFLKNLIIKQFGDKKFKLKQIIKDFYPSIDYNKLPILLYLILIFFILYLPIFLYLIIKAKFVIIIIALFFILLFVKTNKIIINIFSKHIFSKNFKHYIFAALIAVLITLPLYINEVKTGFDNSNEFFKAITEKSEKKNKHNKVENITRNFLEYSKGYYLILTGSQRVDVVGFEFLRDGELFNIKCDKMCRKRLTPTILAFSFLFISILLTIITGLYNLKKLNKSKTIISGIKLDYKMYSLILFFTLLLAFASVAYKFPPRFYLISIMLPYFFLGIMLQQIYNKQLLKKHTKTFIIIIIIMLSLFNLYFVLERFNEQAKAHTLKAEYVKRDIILKEDMRFTLKQQLEITDWIMSNSSHEVVFVWAPPKYYRAVLYHVDRSGVKGEKLGSKPKCQNADYFALTKTKSNNDFFEDASSDFEIEKTKQIGTFVINKVKINESGLNNYRKNCKNDKNKKDKEYNYRYKIKQIFMDYEKIDLNK